MGYGVVLSERCEQSQTHRSLFNVSFQSQCLLCRFLENHLFILGIMAYARLMNMFYEG